ncbi:MAG: glutaminyl-peptide cyclotransferase [Verrucomicrobia bacterium]|nr:glutaminyl-peptide cyclotransferase [Verrucomicrobiota bacterium]
MHPPARLLAPFLLALALAGLPACGRTDSAASAAASTSAAEPTPYTYEVVHTYPHDPDAFTQGLVFLDGQLLESTGLNGKSSLRRVELATGRVLKQVRVPSEYFAEGMTVLGGKIYQLTWQSHKGFVYDLATFALEKEFSYTGEGWGLTTDGRSLILSDGTDQIRFLDPATFAVTRTIKVTHRGEPLRLLNELELIRGELYANIWQSNTVARIDPATGRVLGMIDFYGLLPAADRTSGTDVLNGVAYDAATDRLFVTGKNWPKLFEVRLRPKP